MLVRAAKTACNALIQTLKSMNDGGWRAYVIFMGGDITRLLMARLARLRA